MFETQAEMNTAIVRAGGVKPDSGGYYCPVARTLAVDHATVDFTEIRAE